MQSAVRILYYSPADRELSTDIRTRLHRVMTSIQEFYRQGMESHGFGRIIFPLKRERCGQTIVHFVRGNIPTSGWRADCFNQLKHEFLTSRNRGEHELDLDHQTVVVFTDLLKWKEGQCTEIGPYGGGGGIKYGPPPDCWTAWALDDERLDPLLLSSNDPGAWYKDAACNWGTFNSQSGRPKCVRAMHRTSGTGLWELFYATVPLPKVDFEKHHAVS